jgi:hypothetical protein
MREAVGDFLIANGCDNSEGQITALLAGPDEEGNSMSFSQVANELGLDSAKSAQLYNDVMSMSRGLSIVSTLKDEGNSNISREGLLNQGKAKPDMDGNEANMIGKEKLFAQFMTEVGSDSLDVGYCYTTVNVQSNEATSMDSLEIDSLRALSTKVLGDNPPDGVQGKVDAILEKLGQENPPETKLELRFQFDRIINKNSGDSKLASNKHCKSG